jgi:glycosyltransferase involved in cell wall biosynthesis
MNLLSVIVPVFNEAEFVLPFYYDLKKYLPKDFELIWVDDGSTVSTLEEIEHLVEKDSRISCIALSENYGKEKAVAAGLEHAEGEYILIMHGNLQHPASLIPQMIYLLEQGNDVVSAIPANFATTISMQKNVFDKFYGFLDHISKSKTRKDISDFRLLKKNVLRKIYSIDAGLIPFYSFNLNGIKAFETEYFIAKCKKSELKYSFQHLIHTTKTALQKSDLNFANSLIVTGSILSVVSIATCAVLLSNGLAGNKLVPLILFALALAGAVQLLSYGLLRRKKIIALCNANKIAEYNICDIIVHEAKTVKFSYN